MAKPEHVRIDFLHAFGSITSSEIKQGVCIGDEESNTILYPVGRHIAVRNTETNDINFIREPSQVSKITAIAITPEKSRRFLAVGEYIDIEFSAIVSIFDLKSGAYFKRMRQLGYTDSKVEEFVSLNFSHDSKLLVAASGSNDFIAVIWDWYRDKLIAKCQFPSRLSRITFHPKDAYIICTTGPGIWKNWKVDEKAFKPQLPFAGMDRSKNYIDHAWFDEDIVVAIASTGEAMVAKSSEFLNVIDLPFGKSSEKQGEIKASVVLCTSKNIFFGSTEGTIAIWTKSLVQSLPNGEMCNFEFIRTWSTGSPHMLTSLSVSVNEETLAFSINNNDIGVCHVAKVMQEEIEVKVDLICQGFHKGPITGIDVAVQRPLIVTCCQMDSSVRIWNYVNFRCEVAKRLRNDKDPTNDSLNRSLSAVAFHPSGYYLAVGFEDKVRIFHVIFEDLRFFREISLKNASALKFSNGGQFLAACSVKKVSVYSSFTFEVLFDQNVHTSQIQDLCWSTDDQKLVSVANDGGVHIYEPNSKETDHDSMNVELSSVYFLDNDVVVACGLDSQVSVMIEKGAFHSKKYTIGLRPRLCQIHFFKSYHGSACFVSGCTAGNLQLYGPGPSETILEEIVAHSGPVQKIRSSYDGRYVFSTGDDGVVFIYHVIEPKDSIPQIDKLDPASKEELMIRNVDEKLADIVLISKSSLENFKNQLEVNRQAMEGIRQKRDYILQQQELEFDEKKKELEKELFNEYKTLEAKYEKIKEEKMKKEREWTEKLRNLESAHKNAIENAETLYEKKLTLEDDKFRKLDKEKQELKSVYEEQIAILQKQNEEAIENLAVAFKESLKKTQDDYEETRKTAEDLKLIYEERLSQQEDEHEAEIYELKKKYEKLVEDQTIENTAMRRKNEALIAEQQMFSEEKEDIKLKNDKKLNVIEILDSTKKELLEQVNALEQEKKATEDALIQKEGKIYEYKFQIKDLDKKKNVLDAIKKEILEELQPKDEEIQKLQREMQQVHNDCDKERSKNNELKKNIKEREDLIKKLKSESKVIHNQTEERERSLRSITNDIYNAINNLEREIWPSELDKLYEKFVKKELSKVSKKDPECIQEMEEQLKYMQKSEVYMKQSKNEVIKRSKSDLKKRTNENSTLIQELLDLRGVKKSNENQIKELEFKIKAAKQDNVAYERARGKVATKQASNSNIPVKPPQPLPLPRPTTAKPVKPNTAGKLYKGSPFESKLVNIQEKQRIAELQKDLDEKHEENFYLKLEINQLREQMQKIDDENITNI